MGAEEHYVFPPALFGKARRFLEGVRTYILTETEKMGCAEQGPSEECCIIYSNAFDKIIEYITTYKNILTSIKQEYEAFIARMKNGQRNAFFLHGRLKALESESTTHCHNKLYSRKRAMELEHKIKAIQKNSAKIKNIISEICNVRKEPLETFGTSEKTAHPLKPIPATQNSAVHQQNADLFAGTQNSSDPVEIGRWVWERGKKYIPRQKKTKLEQELLHLLALQDIAEAKREKLKLRYARILLVANAISAWAKLDKIVILQDLPSQIMKNKNERALDVPSKMAKDSLEYFESFSELLSSGQYDAAATYAVNSPRGILCNEEALKYLKSVSCLTGRNLPLLKYFDALINSSTAAGHLPRSVITLEGIKCALSEKQLNLVTRWVKQQRFTFSEAVGDIIYDYEKVEPSNESKCLALAQVVYGQSGALKEVALCLCKRGRISGAMSYFQQLEHFCLDLISFLFFNSVFYNRSIKTVNDLCSMLTMNSTKLIRANVGSVNGVVFFLDALEQVILNDTVYTLEDWRKIAVACAENNHERLSQKIVSILTSQDGMFESSPLEDEKDARLDTTRVTGLLHFLIMKCRAVEFHRRAFSGVWCRHTC
ncbi:clathrin heavy chain linker domain-containing protein 1 [Calonectris borealis]|uniref:clathrin heavy chain linker domain-containing protein 1 n=1 Tax=Calonectris borealis TaxID=1323832 RepID=UPI003F4BF9A4